MFCIAAFIIFIILGVFSVKYRLLAKQAWYCIGRKITFRPCDIGFKEEAKDALLGIFILKQPKIAKFLDRWIEVIATIFVVLSIWSFALVLQSGLNLLVYDTCNPKNVESCSLGGEACGISSGQQTFIDAVINLNLLDWTVDEVLFFSETVSRIPDRFKNWNPEIYLDNTATYYMPYDANKKVALEVIDPGCQFCGKLFTNIKKVGFEKKYNLTYIPYAIPEPDTQTGYKFPNSTLVIKYLIATKLHPINSGIPADWQILEKLFSENIDGIDNYQENFNLLYSAEEAEGKLQEWLSDIGYSKNQITEIEKIAKTKEVKDIISEYNNIIENKIRTFKIPTIIFDGRRYDRVIGESKLK